MDCTERKAPGIAAEKAIPGDDDYRTLNADHNSLAGAMKQFDLSSFAWVDEHLPAEMPDADFQPRVARIKYVHKAKRICVPRVTKLEVKPTGQANENALVTYRKEESFAFLHVNEICSSDGMIRHFSDILNRPRQPEIGTAYLPNHYYDDLPSFFRDLGEAIEEGIWHLAVLAGKPELRLTFDATKRCFDIFVAEAKRRAEIYNPEKLITGLEQEGDAAPLEVRPITDLATSPRNDENELLKHRFLCRGGAMMLVGQSGIGKSSLTMQLAFLWGTGRSAFGIEPVMPLTSLIVQAENDDGDLAEMRDGVSRGLGFTAANMNEVRENVLVALCDSSTGLDFLNRVVAPLLEKHRPDILWIDPLLSYLGGDVSDQEVVSEFLRNGLNPLLRKYDCAAVIIHHTGKPRQETGGKREMSNADFSYAGLGSSELTNWPRAVLVLQQEVTGLNFLDH